MVSIKYNDWGLANWYEDHIELNKNLKKYPRLHNYILIHEKNHKNNFDITNDLKINLKYDFLIMLFCLRYPKTLIDLSPISYRNKKIFYDSNKIILYFILFSLIITLKFI